MNLVNTSALSLKQKQDIFHLWNNEYSEKIALATVTDFDKYLDELTDKNHLLLEDESGNTKGWAATFIRDNEKWFVIILDSSIQKKGYGKKLLDELKAQEPQLSGWVTDHNSDKKRNGEHYQSPLEFYIKNNFTVIPEVRLELEKISAVKIYWVK